MDSYANECPTTLPLTVFTRINYVADFLQAKCDFRGKNGLRGNDDHLRLIGKGVGDFLLVLIELVSLSITAEALRSIIG